MTRSVAWLVFASALLQLLLGGCGRDITRKQVDEPCTRMGQCEVGLDCTAGVCQPIPDAAVDAGTDAGG
jgi:hypothetical protein